MTIVPRNLKSLSRRRSNLGASARLRGPIALALIVLLAAVVAACTTPRPTWQQVTYLQQIDKDGSWFYIRQMNPEELGPDDKIHTLRQHYADASALALTDHIMQSYQSDPDGARLFLERERFECQERAALTCESLSKIYPLSKDPLASFNRKPTLCLLWTVQIRQNDQEIEDLEVRSVPMFCV